MPTSIEQRVIAEAGLRASWSGKVRARANEIAARPLAAGKREDLAWIAAGDHRWRQREGLRRCGTRNAKG